MGNKTTAEIARQIQIKAVNKSKVKHSIFRRIKRSARREYGSKVFYQWELNHATRDELQRRGFSVTYDVEEGYTVKWAKS